MELPSNQFLVQKLCVSVGQIKDHGKLVEESNDLLVPLCEAIEDILRKGLKRGLGIIGLKDCDYWNWIEEISTSSRVQSEIHPTLSTVISIVQQTPKVTTSTARGRLFIRIGLLKAVLVNIIYILLHNPKFLRYWYNNSSVFYSRNDTDAVLSALTSIKDTKYVLKLPVSSFLNETWIIPDVERIELIPCKSIGVTVYSCSGKCVVASVKPGSIAHENNIQPGDCFDELFGVHINEKFSGRLSNLCRMNRGKPINAVVVKGRFADNRWFQPLFDRFVTLDAYEIGNVNATASGTEETAPAGNSLATYDVTFIGSTTVGKDGRSYMVQDGIQEVLKTEGEHKAVKISLLERDIAVIDTKTEKVLGKYSYTETSSCGVSEDNPKHFAFITGNTTCSFADTFECHVFLAVDTVVAQEIISGIGKGFNRTLFCV